MLMHSFLCADYANQCIPSPDTAVVNGNILETKESSITPNDAKKLGVFVDDGGLANDSTSWQIIDEDIEGQSAVTIWRTLHRMPLENARSNTVSLVELKPLTGRYHQLRRHMVSSIQTNVTQFRTIDHSITQVYATTNLFLSRPGLAIAHCSGIRPTTAEGWPYNYARTDFTYAVIE